MFRDIHKRKFLDRFCEHPIVKKKNILWLNPIYFLWSNILKSIVSTDLLINFKIVIYFWPNTWLWRTFSKQAYIFTYIESLNWISGQCWKPQHDAIKIDKLKIYILLYLLVSSNQLKVLQLKKSSKESQSMLNLCAVVKSQPDVHFWTNDCLDLSTLQILNFHLHLVILVFT